MIDWFVFTKAAARRFGLPIALAAGGGVRVGPHDREVHADLPPGTAAGLGEDLQGLMITSQAPPRPGTPVLLGWDGVDLAAASQGSVRDPIRCARRLCRAGAGVVGYGHNNRSREGEHPCEKQL
ncbi:hypothetical protein ACPESR_32310 [Nocardia testacea]|uniref:hypothetical protein n=1 Tax=Nocardia testacea TaxID=248551 RepID=UPI003C2AB901